MKKFCLLVVCLFVVSGCKPGMNLKKASTDAGAGVAAVSALEAVPVEHFEVTKQKMIEISKALAEFMDTQRVSSLPLSDLKTALKGLIIEKGYPEFVYLVETAISSVESQSLPFNEAIGSNNAELIKIAFIEIARNAERCTLDGRTDFSVKNKSFKQPQRCPTCDHIIED